tara:strand:- start:528 stop:722 length:195 start_codon:yes stop_codon:yes gene_type:complete
MNRYLTGTTDQDIMNYMFGTGESKSKTQFLNYKTNDERAHYMVGFLSSALKNAHLDLKILRGEM